MDLNIHIRHQRIRHALWLSFFLESEKVLTHQHTQTHTHTQMHARPRRCPLLLFHMSNTTSNVSIRKMSIENLLLVCCLPVSNMSTVEEYENASKMEQLSETVYSGR